MVLLVWITLLHMAWWMICLECWRSHPALFNHVCVYYLHSKTWKSQQRKTGSSYWLQLITTLVFPPGFLFCTYGCAPTICVCLLDISTCPTFSLYSQRSGIIADGVWVCSSVLFLLFLSGPQHFASKMERHGFQRWTTQWIRNCLDGGTEGVAINGLVSKWRWATDGVPQRSELGLSNFNIFVSNMESGIECKLSKFVSCVVRSTCWRDGSPSRGAVTAWKVPKQGLKEI